MAFNPNEHMMKLKGKDYLQVAWRLVWFREEHPDWGINAECLEQDQEHAIFKAVICDDSGIQKSSGHGSECKKDFGDFLEKAETKAIGRALAMLGYGTQFAADELDEGERIVDSPINRTAVREDEMKPMQDDDRMDIVKRFCQHHGIDGKSFTNLYRGFCKNVLKATDIPMVGSLTDEQFSDMITTLNDEMNKAKETA